MNAEITANDLAVATYRIASLNADIQDLSTMLSGLQAEYNTHRHSFNDAYERYITETQVIIGYTQVWNGEYYTSSYKVDSSCIRLIGVWGCKRFVQQPVYATQQVVNYDYTDGETGTPE